MKARVHFVGRNLTREWYLGMIDQIRRDMQTLRMDPMFHQPSKKFYVERIAAYRRSLLAVRLVRPDICNVSPPLPAPRSRRGKR